MSEGEIERRASVEQRTNGVTLQTLLALEGGKFKDLQSLFGGLCLEDLEGVTSEDLISCTERGNQRLLLLCFLSKYLQSYLKDSNSPFEIKNNLVIPLLPTTKDGKMEPLKVAAEGVLDLHGRIMPVRFQHLREPYQFSLGDLVKKDIEFDKVKVFRCPFSRLLETDIPAVNRLLEKMPNCSEVDLSGNQIFQQNADEHLLRIIRSPSSRLLNIVNNPIASASKDFFQI